MGQLATRVRRRISERSRPDPAHQQLAKQVATLDKRVHGLERELDNRLRELTEGLQEQRALSQRIAVLGDLVAEVVSAAVRGDREELDAALARYADGL